VIAGASLGIRTAKPRIHASTIIFDQGTDGEVLLWEWLSSPDSYLTSELANTTVCKQGCLRAAVFSNRGA